MESESQWGIGNRERERERGYGLVGGRVGGLATGGGGRVFSVSVCGSLEPSRHEGEREGGRGEWGQGV